MSSYAQQFGNWIQQNITLTWLLIFSCRAVEVFSGSFFQSGPILMLATVFGLLGYVLVSLLVLMQGRQKALVPAAIACLPSLIYGAMGDVSLMVWAMPLFVVLAMVILASNLSTQKSWHLGIEYVVLMTGLLVLVTHVLVPDVAHWWVQQLGLDFKRISATMDVQQKANLMFFYELFPKVQTGYMGALWMICIPLWLVHCAKRWLDQFAPKQLAEYVRGVRLGRVLAGAGVFLMGLNMLVTQPVLLDLMPVWLMVFLIVSFSAVHEVTLKFPNRNIVLAAFYIGCLLMPRIFVPIMVVFGCLDCMINLRGTLLQKLSK